VLQSFDFLQPQGTAGVAGHAPITSGRERHRTYFWSIGHGRTFELRGKKALIKYAQPAQDFGRRIMSGKDLAGKPENLTW